MKKIIKLLTFTKEDMKDMAVFGKTFAVIAVFSVAALVLINELVSDIPKTATPSTSYESSPTDKQLKKLNEKNEKLNKKVEKLEEKAEEFDSFMLRAKRKLRGI